MNITPKSKKPMSRDEVACLVELIQGTPVIISKETNAATNKQKEDAWTAVTIAFNAKCGGFPRETPQLKLKWDNLKKAARKRTQAIRMNNLKTGGGKPDFIPPDEVLDFVAGILGATCTGFEVPFGGDGKKTVKRKRSDSDGTVPPTVSDCETDGGTVVGDTALVCDASLTDIHHHHPVLLADTPPSTSTSFLYGMPTMATSLKNKARKKPDGDGRRERNLAIANYYNLKSEKLRRELANTQEN